MELRGRVACWVVAVCCGGLGATGAGAGTALADGPLPSAGGLAELSGTACAFPPGTVTDEGKPDTGCATLAPLVSPGPTVASPDGRFVYVAGGTDATTVFGHGLGYGGLLVLARDPADGALTRVQCLSSDTSDGAGAGDCDPLTAAVDPSGIALSPDGRSVALVASGTGSLTLLSRDAQTGRLTELGCAQEAVPYNGRCKGAPSLEGVSAVTFSPDGRDIYATSPFRSAVLQVRMEADGTLTRRCVSADGSSGSCARTPQLTNPASILVSPDGRFAYALTTRGVTWLVRDTTTGALSPGGCVVPEDATPCGIGRNGATNVFTGYAGAPQIVADATAGTLLVNTGYSGDGMLVSLRRSTGDGTLQRLGCLTQTPYEDTGDDPADTTSADDPAGAVRAGLRQAPACAQTPVLPSGGALVALSDGRFLVTGYNGTAVIGLGADGTPHADGCLAMEDDRCASSRLAGASGGAGLPGGGAILAGYGLTQLVPAPTAAARAGAATVRVAVGCPAAGGDCRADATVARRGANVHAALPTAGRAHRRFDVGAGRRVTQKVALATGSRRAAAAVTVRQGERSYRIVTAVAGLAGTAAPAVSSARCPAGGRIRARTPGARIVAAAHGSVVGCLAGSRPVRLDRLGARAVGPVALAGRFAAVTLRAAASGGRTYTSVAVVDLRHGTLLRVAPAARQPVDSAVAALVLKPSGAIAWTACATTTAAGRCPGGRGDELHVHDGAGTRAAVLAPRRITGLHLSGSTVRFSVAGTPEELPLA